MNKKYLKLVKFIKKLDSVVVAFSGGVDSTFLLKACKDALGENAIALTIDSPYIPNWEINEAKDLAKAIGIKHEIMKLTEIPSLIKNNPYNRCYLCKKTLFMMMKERGEALGYSNLIDGTNFDDIKEYRPGIKALKELNIISPLLENELTKKDVRRMSKALDLPTWDKPAYACLLTRFPYNTYLEENYISIVEKSEQYLMSLGFQGLRVRKHDEIARIEVSRNQRKKLFNEDLLDEISNTLKNIGFKYVCFEASGYSSGSLDEEIVGKDDSNG
jgi:uncharacterized protein